MAKSKPTKKAKSTKSSKAAKPTKTAVRKSVKRVAAPKAAKAGRHTSPPGVDFWVTHTEFATTDPDATKAFTAKVFGWSFGEPFMMGPGNPYHLFAYSQQGGGGVMGLRPDESPRVTPYVHVPNVAKSLEKALKAGAKHIMGPETIMPGVTLAVITIPGDVMVGLSGPK